MAQLTSLKVNRVSLVDRAAVRNPSDSTQPQRLLLYKAEGGANPEGGSTMTDTTVEDLRAQLEKAEAERDAAVAKATELEKAAEKPAEKEESIDKSELDPKVREALQKAEDEAASARKDAQEATELAKAERDLRVSKEFAELAKSEYGHTGVTGSVLKAASESLSEDDYKALTQTLKAADARIAEGNLFSELGKGGETLPEVRDSQEALVGKAEEIKKADPSLSDYEAMIQAMQAAGAAAQLDYLNNVR